MPRQYSARTHKRTRNEDGFSLLEVMIAAVMLTLGLLSIVGVFPYGIEASHRAQDVTQASLLAQSMFEGLKNDPRNFPIIPGADSVIVPLPGNGYDDDNNNDVYNPSLTRNEFDLNHNGYPDMDYDGGPEFDALAHRLGMSGVINNGMDDDGDGVIDDNGDSWSIDVNSVPPWFSKYAPDGNLSYDPEPRTDEEYADGIDNDNDGLIDEDTRLPSVRIPRTNVFLPTLAGDGVDNDGDGEDNDDDSKTPAVADGIDNNGDGAIDEGIDEEIWDGRDNDGDGFVDEDCQLARFPFSPAKFPPPYDRYGWQIRVGVVPDNGRWGLVDVNGDGIPDLGDGIDNDGDGFVDEELPDGLDMDFKVPTRQQSGTGFLRAFTRPPTQDGLVDEDCIAAPLPGWRRVEIVITWGGDGKDNDEDWEGGKNDITRVDPRDRYSLGTTDPSEIRRQRISYGSIEWGVDEEKLDGIDNDFDGVIDEDFYTDEFVLVGFINLSDPSLSFTLTSGQPRGLVSSVGVE
ncbi:MAG: hypothetical protein P9L94_17310 [Candidatus Hinthialibacter antarcticus]|nr:hypothetical protein [Candidatus Hinthialibacter antarcticus]